MSETPHNAGQLPPQVAAANPGEDLRDAEGDGVTPMVPGPGSVIAQAASNGLVPDLTLLALEELLSLDPDGPNGPIGGLVQNGPLGLTAQNADLPVDLTALDLEQLLALDPAGEALPTILEVAELFDAGRRAADEDDRDQDTPDSDAAATFAAEGEDGSPPPPAPGQAGDRGAPAGPAVNAADGIDPSPNDESDGALDEDDDSDLGFAPGALDALTGAAVADTPAGSANNSVADNGAPGNGAPAGANSGRSDAGRGGDNGDGGKNGGSAGAVPGNSAGAAALAVAAISFAGGGDLPAPITPADIASQGNGNQGGAAMPPAAPPAEISVTTPPANSIKTFVAASDSEAGPGNSAFGHSNGRGGQGDTNASGADLPPLETPAPAESNAVAPAADPVVVASGSGDDAITGTENADNLAGGDGHDTIYGLAGDDTLSGGNGRDVLDGGDGNDILDGGNGPDDLFGGVGDDILVWDKIDTMIDGGPGVDTLRADGGKVDITKYNGAISGIENVDLATDAGVNELTLTADDVLSMSDTNTLTIDGNAGDSIDAGSGWNDDGMTGDYHTYTQDGATLHVDIDVSVNANILV